MTSIRTASHALRFGQFAAAAATACLLSACSGNGSAGPASTNNQGPRINPATERAAPAAQITSDSDFIDSMTRFAELNIQLAELELSNGQRPAVQELAEKIKRRESVDLAFLQAERARVGGVTRLADISNDPHAVDDRRRMQAASAEEADTFFVEHMIKHRLEIAKSAEAASPVLQSPNLSYYCRAVIEDSGAVLRELRSVQTAERAVPANARAGVRGYPGSSSR